VQATSFYELITGTVCRTNQPFGMFRQVIGKSGILKVVFFRNVDFSIGYNQLHDGVETMQFVLWINAVE